MKDTHRKYVTLAGGVMVALASGSNYVYSGYAPQLGKRLSLSSTQINLIGMAGNLGVYSSGPVFGKMIDSNGPRLPLILAGIFQFSGYYGIRLFYNDAGVASFFRAGGSSPSVMVDEGTAGRTIGTIDLLAMAICMCLTGFGGSAGLASAVNSVAKSFPDATRATATGTTLAGFGLSAFLFSAISRSISPGDVSSFLLLLALGTSLPMFIGTFIVKPIRPTAADAEPIVEHGVGEYQPITNHPEDEVSFATEDDFRIGDSEDIDGQHDLSKTSVPIVHIQTPSGSSSRAEFSVDDIKRNDVEYNRTSAELRRGKSVSPSRSPLSRQPSTHELSLTRSHSQDRLDDSHAHFVSTDVHPLSAEVLSAKIGIIGITQRSSSVATRASAKTLGPDHVDIFGSELFTTPDFWIIAAILTLRSVVLALANEGSPIDYDPLQVSKYQATQVSIISIYNCLGRVAMGFISDFAKTRFRVRRIWFCAFTSLAFLVSQIAAQNASTISHLWHVSAMLGFAYGNVFGLLPVVSLEFWGLAHFAQNWGYLSISPAIGGNSANLLFGRVYDSHVAPPRPSTEPVDNISFQVRGGAIPDPSDHSHDCLVGQACYATAFRLTTIGCTIAFILSVIVAIRKERQSRKRKSQSRLEAKWARHGEGLGAEA